MFAAERKVAAGSTPGAAPSSAATTKKLKELGKKDGTIQSELDKSKAADATSKATTAEATLA